MPAQRVHLPAVQGPPGQHQVPGLGEDAGEAPLHVQVCRPRLSGNVVVNHTAAERKKCLDILFILILQTKSYIIII